MKLGDFVMDRLSTFTGTVVARAEYLYGCVWVCVVPKKLHDGKPMDDVWFDEQRLVLVVKVAKKREPKKPAPKFKDHFGGPMPSMPKASYPRPRK